MLITKNSPKWICWTITVEAIKITKSILTNKLKKTLYIFFTNNKEENTNIININISGISNIVNKKLNIP